MREWKYTVLFPVRSPHAPKKPELDELLEMLREKPGSTGDLPAGYTYLGQFTIHDVSFLRQNARSPGIKRNSVRGRMNIDRLTSLNKPALDLDSVYGAGLSDRRISFDKGSGAFLLGLAGSGMDQEKDHDLPRTQRLQALIGDRRNDENLLIAQMQVLFMRFHNRIVKDLHVSGVHDPDVLFQRAKEEVTKVYQYLVLHDFLKKLVPESVYEAVVLQGRGALSTPNRVDPTMALEFADAACRLHSLVRASYTINDRRTINFKRMGELTGHKKTRKSPKPLLEKDDLVDWRHFFEFSNHPKQQRPWQHANAISFVVNPFMRELKDPKGNPVDMLKANIRRGIDHGLCTGQEACDTLRGRFPTLSDELELRRIDRNNFVLGQLNRNNSVRTRTPLWLYLMLEAAHGKVGVLGGWIIADVLRTAALNSDIRLSDLSKTQATELYEPLQELARNRSAKVITMEDVIMYTYNYPPNRDGGGK